jgi:hypothetical protein
MERPFEISFNEESPLKIINRNPGDSPHTWQKTNSYYEKTFKRILRCDSLEEKYRRRKGEDKTTVHFGQRKLLLSEIEFLTIVFQNLETDNKKLFLFMQVLLQGNIYQHWLKHFHLLNTYLLIRQNLKLLKSVLKVKLKF